jgi:hypothetical protein
MRVAVSAVLLLSTPAFAATPTWSQLFADSGWTSDSDNNTSDAGMVHVDTRQIEGIPCFRATATATATPDQLVAVAEDIEGSVQWSSAGVTESKVFSKSGGAMEYYQYLDVPGWTMASDRFWFLASTTTKTDTGITFKWNRLEAGGSHADAYQGVKTNHPDAVEPPVNVGGWMFEPKDGKTQVRYYICTDSGGSIPGFVQTAATRKTLPDTLSDLIKEANKRAQ